MTTPPYLTTVTLIKARTAPAQSGGLPAPLNLPVGAMVEYYKGLRGAEDMPENWLECDGSEYRREDFPELAAIVREFFWPRRRSDRIPHLWRWHVRKTFCVPQRPFYHNIRV